MAVTSALPATPEVNEEHSGRSASPETKKQSRTATDTTSTAAAGIYNYGQSYSAYYPRKFDRKNDFAKPSSPLSRRRRRRRRCYGLSVFRPICGCLRCGRGRSGAYRVRNDTLPYFVRSSSVRPVGFNKIDLGHATVVPDSAADHPVRRCNRRRRPRSSPPTQQTRGEIDVTKGRIRLNLYAYPDAFLTFVDGYFARTAAGNSGDCSVVIHNGDDDGVGLTGGKRLSAISEEDVCPLCGGSVDRAALQLTTKIAATAAVGRWNSASSVQLPLFF